MPYGLLPAHAKNTFDVEEVVVAAEGEKFVHIMVLTVCTQCSREERTENVNCVSSFTGDFEL